MQQKICKKGMIILILMVIFMTVNFIIVQSVLVSAQDTILEYQGEILVDNNIYFIADLLKRDFTTPIFLSDAGLVEDWEQRWVIRFDNKDFYLGYIKEFEQDIKANQDTISFLVDSLNNSPIPDQKVYKPEVEAWSQYLTGIIFGGRVWQNKEMVLKLHGKLLMGHNLTKRHYQGQVKVSDGKYYLSGSREGIYSDFGQETVMHDVSFHSHGYSLGYDFNWDINSNF